MKKLQLTAFGDPVQVVELIETAEPAPPVADDVLVRVDYAPLHPSELLMIRGLYGARPALPFGLGQEGVGTVQAIGHLVKSLAIGDRVSLPIDGGAWCEQLVLPAAKLVAVGDRGDSRQFSMLRSNPPTAALLLSQFVDLAPGDWVIQNAGNSGVGRCVTAFAKERGLKVVSLVRRPELVDELTAAESDVVLLDSPKIAKQVGEVTGRQPIRLAIDGVGGEATASLASCLAPGGTLVAYSGMSGKPIQVSALHVIFRDIVVRGFWLGHSRWNDHPQIAPAVALAARLVEEGRLGTPIAAEYSLAQSKLALEHAGKGGKVLFKIQSGA